MNGKEIVKREADAEVPARYSLSELKEQAEMVVAAGLAPSNMKASELAVIMLKGQEEGVSPMEAIQSFYVVKGRVGEMTHYLVQRLREHGHSYIVRKSDGESCTVEFYRKNGDKLPPWTLTFAECHEAGYDRYYDKSKGQYKTKPTWKGAGQRTMLIYRTLSTGIRAYFPEVLHEPTDQPPVPFEETKEGAVLFNDLLKGWIREEGLQDTLKYVKDLALEMVDEEQDKGAEGIRWTESLVVDFNKWLDERGLTQEQALDMAAACYNVYPPKEFGDLPAKNYKELLDTIDEEVNHAVVEEEAAQGSEDEAQKLL